MQKQFLALAAAATLAMGAGCTATTNVNTTPDTVNTTTGNTAAANDANTNSNTPAVVDINVSANGEVEVEPVTAGAVKEFTVHGDNYKFDVSSMKVKKGDTVKVTFINDVGFHDWKLDEFGAATAKLQAGGRETIEFVADKTGTFEYYCSVGNHRAQGMKGTLTVE